eukprot:TRINITY_DN30639_c0_g1_i1.p1 TRINITY_DN30639_c0_g1~~TRINITY_DN30639_c0_g1_i1.p1  ORF type:complete len:330 (+),score=34.70 TRINITY_DN30639_c0_g1_i1:64-1053(+)
MRSLAALLFVIPAMGTPQLTTYSSTDGSCSGSTLDHTLCDPGQCCTLSAASGTTGYYKLDDLTVCAATGEVTVNVYTSSFCISSSGAGNTITATADAQCQNVNGVDLKFRQLDVDFSKLLCQMSIGTGGSNDKLTMNMWLGPNCAAPEPLSTVVMPMFGSARGLSRSAVTAKRGLKPLAVSCPADVDNGLQRCNAEYDLEDQCEVEYSITEMSCTPTNHIHMGRSTFSDSSCTIPKGFLGQASMSTMSIPFNGQCVNLYGGFMSVRATTSGQLIGTMCAALNSNPDLQNAVGYTPYSAFAVKYPIAEGGSVVAPALFALLSVVVASVLF